MTLLYPNDFKYLKSCVSKKHFLQRFHLKSNKPKKYEKIDESLIKTFCERSSIHGVRYIVDDELHKFEKIIWAIIVILAIVATTYVCMNLSSRYNRNLLATVVESTIFPVYEIPFPAVTICNYNGINWKRINEAERKFLMTSPNNIKNYSIKDIELFRRFIARFHDIVFGGFDIFDEFRNESLSIFDQVNITEIIKFMSFECEELFIDKCWWRNDNFNCCDIFSLQKSEYGYCYSFNSLTNPVGLKKKGEDSTYPWRSSSSGEWGGLRFELKIDPFARPRNSQQFLGAKIMIHHPEEWPSDGIFIPSNTASFVVLKPTLSYAEAGTRYLKPNIRQCVFSHETKLYGYETLPNLKYLVGNCYSNCRRQHTMRYCNCSVKFLFPDDDLRDCTASDYHCLSKYAGIFSYEKAPMEINGIGMDCHCIHECYTIDYHAEVTPFHIPRIPGETANDPEVHIDSITPYGVLLDIHFQRNTFLKYRTGVVFGWIDLMVAFGGIAGLFLGSSLLSGVEIIYYMTIRLMFYLKCLYTKSFNKKYNSFRTLYAKKNNSKNNFIIKGLPDKVK